MCSSLSCATNCRSLRDPDLMAFCRGNERYELGNVLPVLLAGALLVMLARETFAQSADMLDSAARLIAMQATVDARGNATLEPAISPREIQLDRTMQLTSDVAIWRGTVASISHWQPYMVAIGQDLVLPLGGFPAADVRRLSLLLSASITSSTTAVRQAQIPAAAADQGGHILFPSGRMIDSTAVPVLEAWFGRRHLTWQTDAVDSVPGGRFYVRVTLLSSRAWLGHGAFWVPVTYTFLMQRDGVVVAWRAYEGEGFTIR